MTNLNKRILTALLALLLALPTGTFAEGVGSPVIPPHTHRGGTATCTERAVCAVCGEAYGEIDPDNHEWGEWTDNEIQNGQMLQKRVCALDQSHVDWQYAPIPEHEHRGGTATCTEPAVCAVCGQPYGDPLGHAWGDWTDVEMQDGRMLQKRVCANDESHVDYRYAALPQEDGQNGDQPPVNEDGQAPVDLGPQSDPLKSDNPRDTTGQAQNYLEGLNQETDPAQEACDHEAGEPVLVGVVDPTCTEAGGSERVTSCVKCGKVLSRELVAVAALGHAFDSIPVKCTERAVCTRCGETIQGTEHDNILQRQLATWVEEYADGSKTRYYKNEDYCYYCGKVTREWVLDNFISPYSSSGQANNNQGNNNNDIPEDILNDPEALIAFMIQKGENITNLISQGDNAINAQGGGNDGAQKLGDINDGVSVQQVAFDPGPVQAQQATFDASPIQVQQETSDDNIPLIQGTNPMKPLPAELNSGNNNNNDIIQVGQASVNTGDGNDLFFLQGDVKPVSDIGNGDDTFVLDEDAQRNAQISVDVGDGFDLVSLLGQMLQHKFYYSGGHFHMN